MVVAARRSETPEPAIVLSPLRVLLVEDSVTDAELILLELRRLGRPINHKRVDTAEEMRSALGAATWDLVIADWSMPRFSAVGALTLLREIDRDLPCIVMSGTVGEECAVQALRAGADDYLLKDNRVRLVPALERAIRDRAIQRALRRAEERHKESEARFELMSSSGIIGIVIGDLMGRILEANEAFLQIIGYSRQELSEGKVRWRDLTAPEYQAVTDAGLVELKARRVATPYEKEYICKDGSRASVLVGMALLDDSRALTFIVDRSAQKGAERALQRSVEQLRQAQKMEAIGRLAGGIAHDFNNLLSVILSYGSMLCSELQASDPMRADLEEICKAGQRASDLTRQLLTFSRQEVVEPRILDLNEVLANMDRMLRRVVGEDVDLSISCGPTLGRIRVDPSHIEQILMNLVVNSRDAMPKGGKLTIETKTAVLDEAYARDHLGATPGPCVMLAVTDTGAGMSEDVRARIFEPFFTTKEKGKGTGLGLSTVFGIVHQCKGSIEVYSGLGAGTTFKIYLPAVEARAEPTRPTISPAALTGSETILLVDDDDQVRAVARDILRKYGYEVIEARGPGEALLHWEHRGDAVDLLLADVVMPQMSGPELAKRLRAMRPGVKVLCVSGYTDDALIHHGALVSGLAYLQKPLTPEALARKVRAVLDSI